MKIKSLRKLLIIITIFFLMLSSFSPVFGEILKGKNEILNYENSNQIISTYSDLKYINLEFSFSDLEIVPYYNYSVIRVKETNHNRIVMFDYDPGKPVIPVNISVFNLPFGSKVIDINYFNSTPLIYDLFNKIIFCKATIDNYESLSIDNFDKNVYENDEPYPLEWVSYHTGGGLIKGEHLSFLVLRVYPVRYFPMENNIQFIETISVNISYIEPLTPIIEDTDVYDMLIISPDEFYKYLQPLVDHKNSYGVKTKLISLSEVYDEIYWDGRDNAEKIKYFIKNSIEKWGITHVLLIGGIKGQSFDWNLPVRYSYVVPMEEQEYPEPSFISDLYFADIYDSEGVFSSWDSNFDNNFSVWNETFKDEMDLYPDVYLGRLPCRTIREVKIMVNKIIKYERNGVINENWFNNLLLVAGDSYVNTGQWPEDVLINEGELAGEAVVDIMPGFNPLRVYASEQDINKKTVNNAFNQGSGFAYFCGHGSSVSWSTHFPPATPSNWTTGYNLLDMIPLRNKEKLPITVVGGCHNGQFDISVSKNIYNGLQQKGWRYFLPVGVCFWWNGWATNCWAWWLTSKNNGGAIATISNTGLGTHGDGDQDNNSVVDYLEILDGWLEIRFFELFGMENRNILGENHGDTLTGYLQRFLDDDHKMDVKMVQQWELFGDPSLIMGGYT